MGGSTGDRGERGVLLEPEESVRFRLAESCSMVDFRRLGRPRGLGATFSATDDKGASSLKELDREFEREDSFDAVAFSMATRMKVSVIATG